jgi:hypothetical protein
MTGDAEDVDAPGIGFHHEEDVPPSQKDVVDVEEVAHQQPVRLRVQELPPTQTRSSWSRPQTCRGKDPEGMLLAALGAEKCLLRAEASGWLTLRAIRTRTTSSPACSARFRVATTRV